MHYTDSEAHLEAFFMKPSTTDVTVTITNTKEPTLTHKSCIHQKLALIQLQLGISPF